MIRQKSKGALHYIGGESRKERRSSASHCMRKRFGIPSLTWSNPLNPIYAENGNRKKHSPSASVQCANWVLALLETRLRKFVPLHNLEMPFNEGRPGKGWLVGFIGRNRLSLKKANMISAERKSVTSNPFVIYDFYNTMEKLIQEKSLGLSQIWNFDDSGFPTDPQRCKVVGVKGKEAYKVTAGAGRENITTLAVVTAASWKGIGPVNHFFWYKFTIDLERGKALPGTFYTVLLLDGHLTHTSIPVLQKCLDDDITIVKLPLHTTDKHQPLYVCCLLSPPPPPSKESGNES